MVIDIRRARCMTLWVDLLTTTRAYVQRVALLLLTTYRKKLL
jgi:hypothetical protein